MLRAAIVRGLSAGGVTASVGLGSLGAHPASSAGNDVVVQTSPYPTGALLIAGIAGLASIVVALITVLGPWWIKRVSERDPSAHATKDEALEGLADALKDATAENARKERTIQRLLRKQGHTTDEEPEHAAEPD